MLAPLLGLDRRQAFGLICDLWAWALGLGPKDQPPTGELRGEQAQAMLAGAMDWESDPKILLKGLVSVGLVEIRGLVVRVRGLDRYSSTWKHNKRNTIQTAAKPQPTAAPDADADADAEEAKRTTLSISSTSGSGVLDLGLVEKSAPVAVFEYWAKGRGATTKFSTRRKQRVVDRLKDGFTVEQLKAAIDGCAVTPHNQGQNDRGEKYDDLELICRDVEHVERFMRNAKLPPKPAGKPIDVRRGMVRAQDVDQTTYGEAGKIHEF